MKRSKSKPKSAPKRVLRLPDLDHTKLSVLNTLGSPQSQRAYGIAIDDTLDPVRNGHGSNMAAFAEQIDDGPVIVPALEMFYGKLSGFSAPQPAPDRSRDNIRGDRWLEPSEEWKGLR